ncbi:MAG: CAP domain-containing protein [Bacillota bacterium]|nr:CAP domain-containing protein [Bacillota bacterium]
MKKTIFLVSLFILLCTAQAYAQTTYTVQSGDSMWKIAAKYQTGISEILAKNPQIKNANLIYPRQKITIPPQSSVKTFEDEVVRLVNVERAKNGLPALTSNWQLARVARYKSQDMINKNYFSHNSPTYGSPFTMMENFGIKFSAAGENIAYGQRTPAEVMNAWMNSPGHRANILNPSYTNIGVGLAKTSSGVCYWSQMFIKPLY